jgi:hypothetical protein
MALISTLAFLLSMFASPPPKHGPAFPHISPQDICYTVPPLCA